MNPLPLEPAAVASTDHEADAPTARAGLPAAGRRTAFVTPYRMPTNAYIEMQKDLVKAGGFDPQPFSLRHLLLEGGLAGLLQRKNIVLAQWIETRPFASGRDGTRLSLVGSLVLVFYWLILALSPARVIYVVHDHAAHDTGGRMRWISRRMLQMLCGIADLRVVHDPASADAYRAHYLPHPLFWDWPGLRDFQDAGAARQAAGPREHARGHESSEAIEAMEVRNADAPLRCAMLGAIRPYKSIDTILRAWPAGVQLLVAGRSSDALRRSLQAIVDARGLADTVCIEARHQTDAEFDAHLRGTDVLILPHATDTALVSGAFFEALGRVPFIVARRSAFIEWVGREFEQVKCFDDPAELPALLDDLAHAARPDPVRTADQARAAFGWNACIDAWGDWLAQKVGAPASRRTTAR